MKVVLKSKNNCQDDNVAYNFERDLKRNPLVESPPNSHNGVSSFGGKIHGRSGAVDLVVVR